MAWIIVGVITFALLWPLVIMWGLNTLFGLGIDFTFVNWLATLVLTATLRADHSK